MVHFTSDTFLGRSNSIMAMVVEANGKVSEVNECVQNVLSKQNKPSFLQDIFNREECELLLQRLSGLKENQVAITSRNKQQRIDCAEWQLISAEPELIGLLTLPADRYRNLNPGKQDENALFQSLTQTIPAFLFRFSLNLNGEMSFLYFARGRQTHFVLNENRVGRAEDFLSENVHPEDLPEFYQSIHDSARELSPWQKSVRLKTKSHHYRWAEGMANPQKQPDGSIEWSGVMLDIHDLMNTRQMLEEMAIAGEIGYWEYYPASNELIWSQQTKRIHEVPEDYVPSVESAINFYKEGTNRDLVSKAVELALNEGKPFDIECEIITQKGRNIWVRAKGKTDFRDGKTLRMFGIFQDITQDKLNRESVRYNEWLYRSSFLYCPVALLQTNEAGLIINANNLAFSMFGYTAEEFTELTRYQLFSNNENELNAYSEKRSLTGENTSILTGIKKDGSTFPVEVLSLIFKDGSGNVLINKALVDLSEQYRMEGLIQEKSKALDRIFNESIDAICSCSIDGFFISLSKACYKNWGYEPEEMIGKSFMDFILPEDQQATRDIYKIILEGEEVRNFNNRYYHKNGKIVMNEWSAKFDALTGLVYAIGRDVTALHQVQAEKEHLMHELIGSNQDLRQFTYITSHNLRAPIANLIGLLELLDYKNQSEEELNDIYLGLKKSGEQLHETISDLNEILIVRNKARTDKEWLRLDELIERLQQQVSCALEKEKVVWQFDFQQFPRLWFNRTYLEGILLNLITNSLKYRSNKRTLTIRIGMDKVGEELRLTFQDNGQGLDTERYKDRLFGLYQRFHNNTDSKGLGLFLAKTQLEALGGRIEAEGKVDEGLTLRLYFQDKQSPPISDPDRDQP